MTTDKSALTGEGRAGPVPASPRRRERFDWIRRASVAIAAIALSLSSRR